jgi:hypothetical protein
LKIGSVHQSFAALFAEKLCFSPALLNNSRGCAAAPGEREAEPQKTSAPACRKSAAFPQIDGRSPEEPEVPRSSIDGPIFKRQNPEAIEKEAACAASFCCLTNFEPT